MISLEEARARILSAIPIPASERLPVSAAVGRIAAGHIFARADLPGFDNSAMDGYAVRASDTAGASSESPVQLRVIERIGAGEKSSSTLAPGTAIRLFTGSMLPNGADAVVMQEDTAAVPGEVEVLAAAKPFENVRLRGEDVRAGTALIEAGARITPVRAALLAATGTSEIAVTRAPRVALLATGSELREPGEPLGPAQIYESNRVMLAAFLQQLGCLATRLPIAKDDLEGTARALRTAFEQSDAVITTGGVSVGEFDFVKDAFATLGGTIDLWKIAMRPGKPFVFGRLENKFLFGLPGNPVSALVTFLLLARPALLRMQGASILDLPAIIAEAGEALVNRGDRRHFVRVRLETGQAVLAGRQASHRIGELGLASGLVDLPPETTLPAGARVEVKLFEFGEFAS